MTPCDGAQIPSTRHQRIALCGLPRGKYWEANTRIIEYYYLPSFRSALLVNFSMSPEICKGGGGFGPCDLHDLRHAGTTVNLCQAAEGGDLSCQFMKFEISLGEVGLR